MKANRIVFVFLLILATAVHADVCIKQQSHSEEYYYGGRMHPAEDTSSEIWFGDNKGAYITSNRIIIVDLNAQILQFVNQSDSTYAETGLPLIWTEFVTEDAVARLERYRTEGVVKEAGETKKIGEWNCRRYDVSTWIAENETRYNEIDEKIWVTTDLPLNWDMVGEINRHFSKLRNSSDEFLLALAELRGFPVLSEIEVYVKGFSVKTTDKVVEVYQNAPPKDVYSVPAGFVKKDKLSMRDLTQQ